MTRFVVDASAVIHLASALWRSPIHGLDAFPQPRSSLRSRATLVKRDPLDHFENCRHDQPRARRESGDQAAVRREKLVVVSERASAHMTHYELCGGCPSTQPCS